MNRSNLNPRRLPLAGLILALVAGPAAAAGANEPVAPVAGAPALPGANPPAPADPIPVHVFTNCEDAGPGSLRQAIADAASGEIVLASPELACSTITLASPLTFGQHDLGIRGLGVGRTIVTAAAGVDGGLINHLGTGQLALQFLTLTGGRKYRSDEQARGGCVYSQGDVTINQSRIVGCVAKGLHTETGTAQAVGGGVFSAGLTTLRLSEVSGNAAIADGHQYASGGGIYAVGGIDMDRSVVAGNKTASTTNNWGGGFTTPGPVTIANSAIINNRATVSGGAHIHPSSGSTSTITNTTVSGNNAVWVGGLTCTGGTFTIASSTITANVSALADNSSGRLIGGGLDLGSGTHTIVSTILTGNLVGNDNYVDSINLSGSTGAALSASGTHNRISRSTLALPPTTNITAVQMSPLALNGSSRPTHALTRNPADIDWGIAPAGQTYDQRGAPFLRTVGSAADVGAFEYDPDYIFRDGFDASIPALPPAS